MFYHILAFVTSAVMSWMEFPKLCLRYLVTEASVTGTSVRYCRKCGTAKIVHHKDEFTSCCEQKTLNSSEVKRDGLVRDFAKTFRIPLSHFIYITIDKSYADEINKEINTRRKVMSKANAGYFLTRIQKMTRQYFLENDLVPIGRGDEHGCWAMKVESLSKIKKIFKTRGQVMSYGDLIFSDTYFRCGQTISTIYDNEYEDTCHSDGGGNLIALSLVNRMTKDSLTPDRIQFRLMSEDVLAKGTAIVVFDWDSRLKGCRFVLGKNSAKICNIKEGSKFKSTILIRSLDIAEHRRYGTPGWEVISWLQNTETVKEYLCLKIQSEITKLANTIFSNDKNTLNEYLYNPNKEERDQSWECQIIRSELPVNHPNVITAMNQLFLGRCADIINCGGLSTILRMAKIDDTISEEMLTEHAIRMPFIGGRNAIIKCTKDGITNSRYMNNWTGLDDDGDDINILSKSDAHFLLANMNEIPIISLPENLIELKDTTEITQESLIGKFLSQLEVPNIGIGANNMADWLCAGNLENARLGSCLAHFCAQAKKKNMVDKNGKNIDMETFFKSFNIQHFHEKQEYNESIRNDLRWSRHWYNEEIMARKSGFLNEKSEVSKGLLCIRLFKMVLELTIKNIKGGITEYYDFPAYTSSNIGILNTILVEGAKIVMDTYYKHNIDSRIKEEKNLEIELTAEEAEQFIVIKNDWGKKQMAIRNCSNIHHTVISCMRKFVYEQFKTIGESISDNLARALINDAFKSGSTYMCEKTLPLAIGDYFGWSDLVRDTYR